jgi:phosphoglucomutase/phosphomannomutase
VLSERKRANKLRKGDFVVTTLVTTKLTERIAESYGVKTFGDNLVGFKYIAGAIEDNGPEHFLYGTEESYGYMAGPYNRDKDGAVAAMLMAELTARCKAEGKTAHEKLDALFWQYGVHSEETVSKFMPGSEGMGRMKALMARLRSDTPAKFGPFKVAQMRDYLEGVTRTPDGKRSKLVGPTGDLVILDFELAGNYVAVRPSGTEPKVKFYMFAFEPPEQIANLEDTKAELAERLKQMGKEMAALADSM